MVEEKKKSGYKRTEVGIIPEDWEIKQLVEVATIVTGSTPPTNDPSNYGNEFLFVSPQDLGEQKWIISTEKKLSLKGFNISRKYPANSVLFTCIGSTIGKIGLAATELTSNQQINSVLPNDLFESQYLYYLLDHISPKIKLLAGTQAVPIINKNEFGKTLITLPNKDEQITIAEALSDSDDLISSLTKLIEKKKKIKQGTMQQQLTGKKRLPGFSGEWKKEIINKLVWYQEGPGVRTSQFRKDGIKLLNGTNINNGKIILETTDRYISKESAFGEYKHFLADEGDIIIACSGISIDRFDEKVSVLKAIHLPLCMNTSTMRFKIISTDILDKTYFMYFLKSNDFKTQISGKATGSAQLNFGPSHVNKVRITFPDIQEQKAIAKQISDMDSEIEALEQKLEKYRKIKQGMMQELLTGRIRLI